MCVWVYLRLQLCVRVDVTVGVESDAGVSQVYSLRIKAVETILH
jgi:hypothetical protein